MTTQAEKKTVVLLGAGATQGSGYTKYGEALPGDRNFFEVYSKIKKSEILQGKYHALDVMLDFFRIQKCDVRAPGLEEFWTFLEFCSMGHYSQLIDFDPYKKCWLERIQRDSSHKSSHCIERYFRTHRTIPFALEKIDLPLLAGWDLRRLFQKWFENVMNEGENFYDSLFKKYDLVDTANTTLISLNYDTILERDLDRARRNWFYTHIETSKIRDDSGIQILKPHGSLNWLMEGNEPCVKINTDYSLKSVCNESFEMNCFKQSFIVAPTQLKKELNDHGTQADETARLLKRIWKSCAEALVQADQIFIIGYSIPGTDHPVRTLLRLVDAQRSGPFEKAYFCGKGDGDVLAAQTAKSLIAARHWICCTKGFEHFVSNRLIGV